MLQSAQIGTQLGEELGIVGKRPQLSGGVAQLLLLLLDGQVGRPLQGSPRAGRHAAVAVHDAAHGRRHGALLQDELVAEIVAKQVGHAQVVGRSRHVLHVVEERWVVLVQVEQELGGRVDYLVDQSLHVFDEWRPGIVFAWSCCWGSWNRNRVFNKNGFSTLKM